MDRIVDKIAALGVPGLVLLVAMSITGWTGAAAITAALAMLGGPFGMLGGIAVLGIVGLISQGLTEYGFEALFKGVVEALQQQGKSLCEMKKVVRSLPISNELKNKTIKDIEAKCPKKSCNC